MNVSVCESKPYNPTLADSKLIWSNVYLRKLVWSFGVVIYEMMHGHAPEREMKSVVNGDPIEFEESKQKEYPFLFSMAEKCLQKDPSKRPTAAQLLQEFNQHVKK